MTDQGKPPDFEPLASSDPVPGDPDQIAALGKRYADTAAEIATQAANLRKLATAAPGGWVGQAGDVFHSKASDLSGRISKAHDRYATTGQALTAAAGPMADAQQRAWAAVWAAKAAQQQMTASAPGPKPPPGSPPPTAAEKAAAQQQASTYSNAQSSYNTASTNFATAVSDYQRAAGAAAGKISTAIDNDGLKDSWWDRNFGWISTVFKIIGIVVLVLAVVAVLLLIPGLGAGLLLALDLAADATAATALVGTITTALEWTAFGLTALQAGFDGVSALTGKESSTAFFVDLASLATFGLGAGASKIVEGLADGAETIGKAVAAGRAGRAEMGTGLGWVYSLGAHGAPGVARFLGLGDRLGTALEAATSAKTALANAVKEAEPGTFTALWTRSEKVADGLAQLDKINSEVPGVLRIGIRQGAAQGVAAINGAVQWSEFAGSNGYSIYSNLHSSGDQAAINAAVAEFRQALSHVP